jgi:site-specific DNA-adenine methylase
MPFKYSGNKRRMLKYLPAPPHGMMIVEPFAGSAAYSMAHSQFGRKIQLAEANEDVRVLWEWLRTEATEERLIELEKMRPKEKVQVATLKLPKPEETLMRLTCSGVYTGQLSSTILYSQHSVDFSNIRRLLPVIRNQVLPLLKDYRETVTLDGFMFLDPPYLGTQGNYKDKTNKIDQTIGLSDLEIRDFVLSLKQPYIFTYGDDAPEVFPDFDWQLAMIKKVPRIRTGGVIERREWFCVGNSP